MRKLNFFWPMACVNDKGNERAIAIAKEATEKDDIDIKYHTNKR